MKLDVRFRGMEGSTALHTHAVRQVYSHLRPFDAAIAAVTVRVEDTNGPKAGVDKRCQVEIRSADRGWLRVDAESHDAFAAIERAVERAAEAVGRGFRQERSAAKSRGVRRAS